MASASELQMIPLVRLTSDQFQAARRRGRVVQWLSALFAWLLLGGVLYFLINGWFIASMIGAPLTTEQSRSGAYGFFVSDNTTTASSTTSPSIPRRRRISRCFTGCSVADY
jgi:hypothetical protein